ncbi:MAG: hypothetical protein ACTHJR_03710 [Sphingomonas sp.]|uniref:hypothetical protein n=1 Tax=Sphingomonas sp. TaxID=28214 RepID=UPI003F7E9F08
MTMLSVKFARTLQRGRAEPAPPPTRAGLLLTLLRKRAAAHNVGAEDLEAMLRDQIRWSLPMRRGADAESDSQEPAAAQHEPA